MSIGIRGMFGKIKEDKRDKAYDQIDSSKQNIITSLNRNYSSGNDSDNSLNLDTGLDTEQDQKKAEKRERREKKKAEKAKNKVNDEELKQVLNEDDGEVIANVNAIDKIN